MKYYMKDKMDTNNKQTKKQLTFDELKEITGGKIFNSDSYLNNNDDDTNSSVKSILPIDDQIHNK